MPIFTCLLLAYCLQAQAAYEAQQRAKKEAEQGSTLRRLFSLLNPIRPLLVHVVQAQAAYEAQQRAKKDAYEAEQRARQAREAEQARLVSKVCRACVPRTAYRPL